MKIISNKNAHFFAHPCEQMAISTTFFEIFYVTFFSKLKKKLMHCTSVLETLVTIHCSCYCMLLYTLYVLYNRMIIKENKYFEFGKDKCIKVRNLGDWIIVLIWIYKDIETVNDIYYKWNK